MRKVLIVCAYMSIAKSMNSEHIVHLVYSISVTVLDAQNIERYSCTCRGVSISRAESTNRVTLRVTMARTWKNRATTGATKLGEESLLCGRPSSVAYLSQL